MTYVSPTQLQALSPPEAPGTVDVLVQTENGPSQTNPADQFTFAGPTVSGISPTYGSTVGGTTVTITGTNFSPSESVYFGSVAATSVTYVSSTQLQAVSPAEAAGTVDVTVQIGNYSSPTSAADQFRFISPPVAVNDGPYSVLHDHVLSVAAPGVLANDSDPNNYTLQSGVVQGPAHGTLTLNSDGSFNYFPTQGYVGADSFTYQDYDGYVTSNVATVTINVTNQDPVAVNDSYSVLNTQTLTVSAPGVLANDSDPDGDTLKAMLVQGAANGSLMLNSDGSFTYRANAGYVGTDTFTYKDWDGASFSNVATVSINVTQGSAPQSSLPPSPIQTLGILLEEAIAQANLLPSLPVTPSIMQATWNGPDSTWSVKVSNGTVTYEEDLANLLPLAELSSLLASGGPANSGFSISVAPVPTV